LEAAEGLARVNRDSIAYQELLEQTLSHYAQLKTHLHDLPSVEALLERAAAIAQHIASVSPKATRHQFNLAQDLLSLGWMYSEAKKFSRAEHALRGSVAALEALSAEHSQDVAVASYLGGAYSSMQNFVLFAAMALPQWSGPGKRSQCSGQWQTAIHAASGAAGHNCGWHSRDEVRP
jgi:hypothetical protein